MFRAFCIRPFALAVSNALASWRELGETMLALAKASDNWATLSLQPWARGIATNC
jgi:hypothetical protein